ncbi:MAG: response regulator [Cyanobacteria bacterium SIG30]|nr:response regulator [Cyanobacteria bacterium SIG30]
MAKYRILIVDDEPDNLALLYRTLRGEYEVVKANSPIEALKIIENESFELILSDHKMPEMDGVEFLKLTQLKLPNAVRLLVTAYSDAKILIDAINYAKIYRYIKKPFEPAELLYIVQASLEYYQLKIDNENLIDDFKDLFEGTIKSITEALDAKDSFTLGKSRKITFYALKLAQKLGLSKEDQGRIELAGLLHDIGMIGVPEDILNKTDSLTDEEYEEIKKHVVYGIKILEDIKQLNSVIEIIKYHHEFYDGCGYPFKIKGEEIPIGSRIISLTDAYVSLISNRKYREKVDGKKAIDIMREKRGTQFDPNLFDIFESIAPEIDNDMEKIEEYLSKKGEILPE